MRESKEHRRFAPLEEFLEHVPELCPDELFRDSFRASQLTNDFADPSRLLVTRKENFATRFSVMLVSAWPSCAGILAFAHSIAPEEPFYPFLGNFRDDYSGTVAGMSGQDTLDLVDINFASAQTPSFSGNSSGGTLSVTDGSHTANIALLGNYMASSFVASSDGHGGTSIVDPTLASDQSASLVQPQHA